MEAKTKSRLMRIMLAVAPIFPAPPANTTLLVQQLNYINNLTDTGNGGVLGIVFLIIIGGALFMMIKGFGNERALGVSSIIVAIIGIFLRLMQNFGLTVVGDKTLTICIIVMVFGIYLLVKEGTAYDT